MSQSRPPGRWFTEHQGRFAAALPSTSSQSAVGSWPNRLQRGHDERALDVRVLPNNRCISGWVGFGRPLPRVASVLLPWAAPRESADDSVAGGDHARLAGGRRSDGADADARRSVAMSVRSVAGGRMHLDGVALGASLTGLLGDQRAHGRRGIDERPRKRPGGGAGRWGQPLRREGIGADNIPSRNVDRPGPPRCGRATVGDDELVASAYALEGVTEVFLSSRMPARTARLPRPDGAPLPFDWAASWAAEGTPRGHTERSVHVSEHRGRDRGRVPR